MISGRGVFRPVLPQPPECDSEFNIHDWHNSRCISFILPDFN